MRDGHPDLSAPPARPAAASCRRAWRSPSVTEIRAIARRPLAVAHPKLRVIQHQAFDDYSAIADAFVGVDACLYCLGKSSTQVSSEAEYRRLTYDYALAAARAVWRGSPTRGLPVHQRRQHARRQPLHVGAGEGRDRTRPPGRRTSGQLLAAGLDRRGAVGERADRCSGWRGRSMRLLKPFRSLYVRAERHRARDAGGDGAGHPRANLRERRDPRPRGPRALSREPGMSRREPGR